MNTSIILSNPTAFKSSAPEAKIMWALNLLVKLNFPETHSTSVNIADLEAAFKSIDYDFESEYDMTLLEAIETYSDIFTKIELEDGSISIGSPQLEQKYSVLIKGPDSMNEEEVNEFHHFLKETIREKRNPQTGYTSTSDIGQKIREDNILLPKGINKVGEFLKLFPEIYESRFQNGVSGSTEVCLVKDKDYFPASDVVAPTFMSSKKENHNKTNSKTQLSKKIEPQIVVAKNHGPSQIVSAYRLLDNLLFPNCEALLIELCRLSNDPALLIMPESEPSPYEMVMHLLELRWCEAVQTYSKTSNDNHTSLILAPTELWFNTGLSSIQSSDCSIWIHAIYNTQANRPQWLFDRFEEKSDMLEP